ncbi:MAG: single-stranded-DNA-specific exonuclease RecJ, partial [Clostridia bacterium]|nr:single-stranded-DNA-specific exonuclease RecJ [Clostridia bacterium]
PILHRLLLNRGIAGPEAAERFLRPTREQLLDPFLLNDMERAAALINEALGAGEHICVYGDYDVDGVCASAILSLYLREQGADVSVYLPSRHKEGYGLNADAVEHLAKNGGLLITVDCGITSCELVTQAKQAGLKVIVTDHHRPGETLPDCPTVNPLLGSYPFGFLCGAGVAFKLVEALGGREKAMEYIDLACLATIADIVPLKDENRVIAALGLRKMNLSMRPGLRALCETSGLGERELSAGNVAFQLSPRINAAGRMGDALLSYRLLTETNYDKCLLLARELDELNSSRRSEETRAFAEAESQLDKWDFSENPVIIVRGDGWNSGVIGLAASKLTEKYHCPSVVLTKENPADDFCTGSCRSIEGVSIHDALTNVREHLLRFGGHEMAAGLRVREDELDSFARAINAYVLRTHDRSKWIPRVEYDLMCDPGDLDVEMTKLLIAFEPTGCQNPPPVLLSEGEMAECRPVGRESEHLKFALVGENGRLPGIWFRAADKLSLAGSRVQLIYSPGVNEFRGAVTVQALARSAVPLVPSFSAAQDPAAFGAFIDTLNVAPPQGDARLEDVRREFASGLYSRCVVCADGESARAVMEALDGEFDLSFGEFPRDIRGFNCVAVCPASPPPARFKRVYYAGVPKGLCGGGIQIKGLPAAQAFGCCPDTDALRGLYRVMLGISRLSEKIPDMARLLELARVRADISPIQAMLGIKILSRMGLVSVNAGNSPVEITVSREKRSPEDEELFKLLAAEKTK